MSDKRRQPKLKPPKPGSSGQAHAFLSARDYRLFHEVVMRRGTSGAETIRKLIREEHDRGNDA